MLSKTTKYGLKTVMHLAFYADEDKMYRAEELALELKIPKHFLSRVLHDLSKRSIISSQKGPGGGFFLSKSQLKLYPYDVIKALQGDDFLNVCIFEQRPCIKDQPCVFHDTYSKYKRSFIEEMSSTPLKEYVGRRIEGI
jgi:Rrf2 family protein